VPEARMWQSTDRALEYFEEGLLFKLGADDFDDLGWTVAAFGGEWGLDAEQCETLDTYLIERTFDGGEALFEEGDTDCSMFLLGNGLADISVSIGENRRHRVGTASRGTVIGEISLLDGRPRSATVEATGPLTVYELTAEAFDRMLENDPQLSVRVQAGLARILAERLRRASELMIELES
jgi:sulfate permease, SulP family